MITNGTFRLENESEKKAIKCVQPYPNNKSTNRFEKGIIAFTKGRATTIRNYLAIQGIDEKRIEIDGKGDHEMLFKLTATTTADQQEQNRRVEILVLDF